MVNASDLSLARLNLGRRSNSSSSLGSMEYGNMPTALAEEVLKSNSPVQTSKLPDWIPGQSNFASSPQSPASPFSFFSRSSQLRPDSGFTNIWTTTNAAVSGLAHMQFVQHGMVSISATCVSFCHSALHYFRHLSCMQLSALFTTLLSSHLFCIAI